MCLLPLSSVTLLQKLQHGCCFQHPTLAGSDIDLVFGTQGAVILQRSTARTNIAIPHFSTVRPQKITQM